MQLRTTLITEWSLLPSLEAVSIVEIAVSSCVRARSRSDGSFVPVPLVGSVMCCIK